MHLSIKTEDSQRCASQNLELIKKSA